MLKCCSDINEQWTQWDKLFVFFIVLKNVDAWLIDMSFLHVWVRFQVVFFPYCTLTETCEVLFQNWTDSEWRKFGVLLMECASFRRPLLCLDLRQREKLIFFTSEDIKSLRWLFGVCSGLLFMCALIFSNRFFWYRLTSFNLFSVFFCCFLFFILFSDFFLVSSGQNVFCWLLKINYSIFKPFITKVECLVKFCTVYCSSYLF